MKSLCCEGVLTFLWSLDQCINGYFLMHAAEPCLGKQVMDKVKRRVYSAVSYSSPATLICYFVSFLVPVLLKKNNIVL